MHVQSPPHLYVRALQHVKGELVVVFALVSHEMIFGDGVSQCAFRYLNADTLLQVPKTFK